MEALTAVWFGIQAGHLYSVIQFYFKAQNHDLGASAAFALLANLAVTLVGFFLIGLMLMDWETGLLPDSFTFPGILLGLLIVCAQAIFLSPGQGQILVPAGAPNITSAGAAKSFGNIFMTGPEATILGRVFAVGFAACLMLLLRQGYKILRHRDGMGLGDVKLLAMIVAFLGFWPGILSLFLGTLMASAYAVFLLVRGKAGADTKIAFGSFLAAGGMVSAQIGDRIIEAYSQLLR